MQGGSPAEHRTSRLAVAALGLGVLGVVGLPLVASVAALACGYAARRAIDASGGARSGRELAVGGIVLGWVGVGLWGGVLLLALGFQILG